MRLISRLLVVSASLLIACDPGYTYHPDDWQPLEKGYSWKKSLEGIDITISSIGNLLGSKYISFSLEFTNRTDKLLVLEGAELIVQDNQIFKADLPDSGALRWRSIGANQSKSIDLSWTFNQPAIDVLGEHPEVIQNSRIYCFKEVCRRTGGDRRP